MIFNPAARGEKAQRTIAHLKRLCSGASLRPTAAAGDGERLAFEAAREGFDVVVAVGGDGTMNEVVNGIARNPGGLSACSLGIVPQGTANVLAKELAIPPKVHAAWDVIQAGHTRRIDVILAQFEKDGEERRRFFVQLAGAGLDARATEVVDWSLKKRWGFLAYVVACLKAMREKHASIVVTDDALEAQGELVLLGNGRFYGGAFEVFPGADLSDGKVDAAVLPRITSRVVGACCWAAATNRWAHLRCVERFKAPKLRLASSQRVPLEVDGEPVGVLPATLAVQPLALNVIVP